jgi:hypothetical protein
MAVADNITIIVIVKIDNHFCMASSRCMEMETERRRHRSHRPVLHDSLRCGRVDSVRSSMGIGLLMSLVPKAALFQWPWWRE